MTDENEAACCAKQYPYHGAELSRINRLIGQLEGARKMIEERRYCPDIITVLRAARSAIKSVESNILETYLGSCVTETFSSSDEADKKQKIAELKTIFKRFDE